MTGTATRLDQSAGAGRASGPGSGCRDTCTGEGGGELRGRVKCGSDAGDPEPNRKRLQTGTSGTIRARGRCLATAPEKLAETDGKGSREVDATGAQNGDGAEQVSSSPDNGSDIAAGVERLVSIPFYLGAKILTPAYVGRELMIGRAGQEEEGR